MNPSPSLAEQLMAQLQGTPLQQLAAQLGESPARTESAVGTALPMLLGALGRNAAEPQGAADLLGALQRGQGAAGGGLDLGGLLGSMLGGGASGAQASAGGLDGAAVLGQILGGSQQRVQDGVGQATGLGSIGAEQLLKLLAPIVMSFLAQRVSAGGFDASSLGQALGLEHGQARQQGGLGGLLDQDGDGQVGLSDLLKIGGGLLSGRR